MISKAWSTSYCCEATMRATGIITYLRSRQTAMSGAVLIVMCVRVFVCSVSAPKCVHVVEK